MSEVVCEPDMTAIALGNPIRSRVLREARHDEQDGILMRNFLLEGCIPGSDDEELRPDSGTTFFINKVDHERYEVGDFVIVRYSWNDKKDECIENAVLREQTCLDIKTFQNEILNKIKHLLPVTLVEIRTITDGSLEVTELPREIPDTLAYPPIPDSLASLPSVQISDLRKPLVSTLYDRIDIVTIHADPTDLWYIFKRYAIPIDKQNLPMDILLSEVEHLSRVESSYIIKPCYIVTDDSKSFRGYLLPFMPAGTLEDVFEEIFDQGCIIREPLLVDLKLVEPLVPPSLEERDQRAVAMKPSHPQLSWSVKHTWAIEAARALVTLHEHEIYSGDVKLNNIVLGRDGHLQLIDVAPQDGYTYGYMAPEFDLSEWGAVFPLSAARDIYAFGVVLWQIAEEVGRIDLQDPPELPDLTSWRSDSVPGSTPQWYQDLVARCVDGDPAKRPSAKDVLQVLENNVQ